MFGRARKSRPLRIFDAFRKRCGGRPNLFRCIAAAGLAVIVTGCAASRPMGGSVEAIMAAREAAQTYRLAAGDKLHVAVFNEDNLSGDFVVGPDGRVALPLAGPVQAAGLTLPQFQQAVTARLKDGVVQNPSVAVTASDLRPYYILGEVNKPGKYSYTPELTVMNAVATAEGFTYRADKNMVYVRHAADSGEREMPLTATTAVLPGDTIRIEQRYF
jgi:polysaccharide export outer membrane protein